MTQTLEVQVKEMERHHFLASQVSNTSNGSTSVVSGRARSHSVIPTLTNHSSRPRGLSVLSVFTNRTNRSSRCEMVEMPGGAMMVAVDEDTASIKGKKDSLTTTMTVGGVATLPDTEHFDKKIKKEMAHHSPAVGNVRVEDDIESVTVSARNQIEEDEPVFAFGATNLLQHLCLALASPALVRLPALAYKWSSDEGSGFFTAYAVLMIVLGVPLCFLEQTLAQFSSLGVITIFRCLPLFTGVGVGMVATCVILMGYSSTMLAWLARYMFDCLRQELPWTTCPDNETSCWSGSGPVPRHHHGHDDQYFYSPNDFYFLNTVLGVINMEDGQLYNFSMIIIQVILWLGLLLLLSLGKTWRTGVVSKLWSLVTIAMLFALTIQGLTIDQSGSGLRFVFKWKGDDLNEPDIWLDAFGQIVWSLGPTLGLLISRASYKGFRERIRKDVYTAAVTNMLVAVVICLALFPYQGKFSLHEITEKTPGYFFVISSFAVSHQKLPQLAGFVLYTGVCEALLHYTKMLVSTVVVSVSDLLPVKYRSGTRLFACKCFFCLLGFLISLPYISKNGIFLMESVDAYVPWVCGLVMGTLEVLGFVYIYGADNISRHFKQMQKSQVQYFCLIWKFLLLPSFMVLIMWASIEGVSGPVNWNKIHLETSREKMYETIGLIMAVLPPVLVLVTTFFLLVHTRQPVKSLLVPWETWGPALQQHRALYTPSILRAKSKAPYLIIHMETDSADEVNEKGWLPYGYFMIPQKSPTKYVITANSPVDTSTKEKIAKYLKSQFGSMGDEESVSSSNNDLDSHSITEDNFRSNMGRIRRYGVTKLAWADLHHAEPMSGSSLASGVLLRPNNLLLMEIDPQEPSGHSCDNPAYEV
nr:sodium-dependent noradrenaline transporter-like [Cherax quadricarinatus]